jgi:hypothetical protein
MLVIHQALHIPMMTHNLIGLMQLRDNGIFINDEPEHMALTPTDDHHCISIPATKDTDALRIPLSIKGVVSYFPTWKPTAQEYESCPLSQIIELTSETIDWDPQSETRLQVQEDNMLSRCSTYSTARLPTSLPSRASFDTKCHLYEH